MHGGVTEDGESVMLLYRPKRDSTKVFAVTKDGFVSRLPPSDTADLYSANTSSTLGVDRNPTAAGKTKSSRSSPLRSMI